MQEQSKNLDHIDKAVCIFGSARSLLSDRYYKIAEEIAAKSVDLGFATVTGAGPGIMESANKGAYDAGGESVGIRIQLPFEQYTNPYLTECHNFEKFYSRKCSLVRNADVFIVMPGGFGTLDEAFEVLTLIQCEKFSDPRKVIFVGVEFYGGLIEWITEKMTGVTICDKDLELIPLVDTVEEAMVLIKEFNDNVLETK